MGEQGLDRSAPEQGQVSGICNRGSELSGPIKCGKILD